MRRRSFVLAETLIASTLAIMVMVACLSLFVILRKASVCQQAALEKEGTRWRRASSLRWILSRIHRDDRDKDPFVLENRDGTDQRLLFVFDHGVHIDPQLANEDLAQLYLDPHKGLVLVTRSHKKRGKAGQDREETSVIWPGARRIIWRFAPRPADKANRAGIENVLKDGWTMEWRAEWAGLPAVIQAVVVDEEGAENEVTAIVSPDIGVITLK